MDIGKTSSYAGILTVLICVCEVFTCSLFPSLSDVRGQIRLNPDVNFSQACVDCEQEILYQLSFIARLGMFLFAEVDSGSSVHIYVCFAWCEEQFAGFV